MNIAILTIPAQSHRLFATLGHLRTLGFPVEDESRLKIYNGYDVSNYISRREVAEAMSSDGYATWQELVNNYPDVLEHPDYHNCIVEWSMLKILREVEKSGEDTLVLENDVWFKKGIDYRLLQDRWDNLKAAVPYESIGCAMLMFYEELYGYRDDGAAVGVEPVQEGEQIDDFWVKGARSGGQVANIYTPHGAEWMQAKPAFPTIEMYVKDNPNMFGLFSARENCVDWQNYYFDYDSPHDPRDADAYSQRFEGINLSEL